MDSQQLLSKKTIILALLGIAVVIIIVNIVGKQAQKAPLTQKECLPLYGNGKQTYDILADKSQNPQIVQVEVDPIDVRRNQTQTVTVKVQDKNSNAITKESGVAVNVFTDNQNFVAALKLVKAEDMQGDSTTLLTTWQGSWVREDSNCNTYMQTITAVNSKGEKTKVDLSFK